MGWGMINKPTFEEFFTFETIKLNYSLQEHHPFYHYDGANASCNKCNPKLETPLNLYKRMYPIAISDNKEIDMEILEDTEDEQIVLKTETFDKNDQYLFHVSRFFANSQLKRQDKIKGLIGNIETAKALHPTHLNKKHVLCLPSVEFTRSLSIIQCLIEMEQTLGKKIHEQYDVISATGDSSIIAVACGLGEELNSLKEFWVTEWRQAYTANILDKALRSIQSFNVMGKNKSGFSAKKAKKILSNFLKIGDNVSIQKTFHDLKTEVYLPALFARMKETFAYTKATSKDLPLCDALADLCLNPMYFDIKETVNGKGIPLNIKDSELFITQGNKGVLLTKIEVPYLHTDYGNLDHATDKELAPVIKDSYDFLTKIYTENHEKNFKLEKIKYVCKEIPANIKKNSVRLSYMFQAIEAGKGITPVKV